MYNIISSHISNINNISNSDRLFRIALSLGLIVVIFNHSGTLGSMVYLPFVSIYTGITAFIGWDPINAMTSKVKAEVFTSAQAKNFYARQGKLVAQ